MDKGLENKIAIVTGGGGKTGAAIASVLARAGARVAVNDINPERAERAAADIRAEGGKAVAVTADIANRFQCVNLIESTREQWGRIDILVNNATVQPQSPILKMDEWAWQRCLDVNLKGAFFMSQLVGRVMADENQDRGGVIINIGASPDDLAETGYAAYAASKAGLEAFSAACAREYAPLGIHVHTVQPDGAALKQESQAAAGTFTAQEIAQTVLRLCVG